MILTPSEKHSQIFEQAMDHYGFDKQLLKTMEELAELSVSLMHYRDGKADKWSVCEEIADCIIMCQQMASAMGKETVESFYIQKMLKLEKRFECHAV